MPEIMLKYTISVFTSFDQNILNFPVEFNVLRQVDSCGFIMVDDVDNVNVTFLAGCNFINNYVYNDNNVIVIRNFIGNIIYYGHFLNYIIYHIKAVLKDDKVLIFVPQAFLENEFFKSFQIPFLHENNVVEYIKLKQQERFSVSYLYPCYSYGKL